MRYVIKNHLGSYLKGTAWWNYQWVPDLQDARVFNTRGHARGCITRNGPRTEHLESATPIPVELVIAEAQIQA